MKTNKILMAVLAVFAISLMSFSAIAYRGNTGEVGPNYNEDVHEQLQAALVAEDYDLWMSIREENNLPMQGKMFSVINEDNFDKFVELHNAKFAGDTDTVDEIRAELGLGQGGMNHGNNEARGMGHGPRQGMKGQGSFGKHQGNSNGGYFVDADNDGNCDNIGLNMGQI